MRVRPNRRVPLVGHPGARSSAIRALEAEIILHSDPAHGIRTLGLRYVLEGELSRLRVPAPAPRPRHTDELWRHTCFEAFIAPAAPAVGGAAVQARGGYLELNFSPSGDWAAYAFDGYRTGQRTLELEQAPQIRVVTGADQLELYASVYLPADQSGERPARLAVTAVVEDTDGSLYYWSARHPAGKADFHHPDNFLLELTSTV